MELVLKREIFTEKSTIGSLSVNGKFECFILEDTDRGLKQDMTIAEINKIKQNGVTCIPYGRYIVAVSKSQRFTMLRKQETYLPIVQNVPGYKGIRAHTGNKPEDTEGCLLPALKHGTDTVTESTPAFVALNEKINNAITNGEVVTIHITK